MDNLKQSGFVNHVTPTAPSRSPVQRKPRANDQRRRQPDQQQPKHGPDEDHKIDEYA